MNFEEKWSGVVGFVLRKRLESGVAAWKLLNWHIGEKWGLFEG